MTECQPSTTYVPLPGDYAPASIR